MLGGKKFKKILARHSYDYTYISNFRAVMKNIRQCIGQIINSFNKYKACFNKTKIKYAFVIISQLSFI